MYFEKLGAAAALELLAEECAELGHAALKRARILRGENPTPESAEEAEEKLREELADVIALVEECAEFTCMDLVELNKRIDAKAARFVERMERYEQEKKP